MSSNDFKYRERSTPSRDGVFLRDQYGRSLILHGVNVSGACKLPNGPIPACLDPDNDEFLNTDHSFVGRPFPLEEAEVHFRRLQSFGLSLIRLVITWEAVERRPGVYDEAYLDYLQDLVQVASDVGLLIILDFHQDCWSRFTGGSGAPLWTFEVAGLVPRNFQACGAALLQKADLTTHAKAGTLWATNYTKFAVNTMFTLFFGGEVYAPAMMIDGENIGSYLRRHYFDALTAVLDRVKHLSGVIGVDAMNEPHHGFIGLESLHKFDEDVLLHLEHMPTAVQSMRLAAGIPQKVPYFTKSWPKPTRQTSERMLNSEGVSAWTSRAADCWRSHGVYDETQCVDDYFAKFPAVHARAGQKVDFTQDFYTPFLQQFVDIVRNASPHLIAVIEPVPNTTALPHSILETCENICYAPHWYDLQVLFEKRFSSWLTMNVQALSRGSRNLLAHTYFGHDQTITNYTKQYAAVFADAPCTIPRLVGETGIPFDMNHHYLQSTRRGRADDYAAQEEMMDIMCTAMERNLLSYTLWNYTPENRAYDGGGDLWNGEDFSIFCTSEIDSTTSALGPKYAGTRAHSAWIRPNATKVAGDPIRSEFDLRRGKYHLSYKPTSASTPDTLLSRQTELFVPSFYASKLSITCRDSLGGELHWQHDQKTQTVHVWHEAGTTTDQKRVIEIVLDFGIEPMASRRAYLEYKYFWLLLIVLVAATSRLM